MHRDALREMAFNSMGNGSVFALKILFVQLWPDVKGVEPGAAQHGNARRMAGDLRGQQAMQIVDRDTVVSANSRMTSPF